MTPGARLSAAMEILDAVLAGEAAQRVLAKAQLTSGFALAPFVDGQGAVQPPITIP